MRKKKAILLHIPTQLVQGLNHYLENNYINFKYDINKFYYLIQYIMEKHLVEDKKEFIKLNKTKLKKLISNIERYIKVLDEGEFLLKGREYIPRERSNEYKINPKYLNGETTTILILPDSIFFNKIVKYEYQRKAHYNRFKPFLREMCNKFNKIEFDYDKAIKWVEKNASGDKKTSYLNAITRIKDKRFRYFKRNTTNNRLDTNLTNLKSELREFIKEDLISIDLRNSQPFLLSQLFKELLNNNSGDTLCCYFNRGKFNKTFGHGSMKEVSLLHQNHQNDLNGELITFTDSVAKGVLYDDFTKLHTNEITRKDSKNIMFKVLFSRNKLENKCIPFLEDKIVFMSVFPNLYRIIYYLKFKSHSALSILLQKLESYIFIDCIAKELVDNSIIPLTIHDSVLVNPADKDKTMEVIEKVFLKNFGVIPSFEIKPLKKSIRIDNQEPIMLNKCA